MSTVIVRAGRFTTIFHDARAVLVEEQRSKHVVGDDGVGRLTVVEREATWTISTTKRVDGWIGGINRAMSAPGETRVVWEYSANAELIDDVTVEG